MEGVKILGVEAVRRYSADHTRRRKKQAIQMGLYARPEGTRAWVSFVAEGGVACCFYKYQGEGAPEGALFACGAGAGAQQKKLKKYILCIDYITNICYNTNRKEVDNMKKLIVIDDKMMERLKKVQIEVAMQTGAIPSMQNVIYNMIISGLNNFERKQENEDNNKLE